MALDFPSTPANGDTFLGTNGVNYLYDATDEKWQVFVDPAAGNNLWSRDIPNGILSPLFNGDDVRLHDSSGNTTMHLDSNGTITAESIDIDAFDALP